MSAYQEDQRPTYDPVAVQPMRDELIAVGFKELLSPEAVDSAVNQKDDKTVLVVVNSVCGCAAGSARPGICAALQHSAIPDRITTVFAGQDKAAVARLREHYLSGLPASSPTMTLFKNGEVLFMMHRQDIEGRGPEDIAAIMMQVFDEHCQSAGPSITPEQYAQVVHAKACGSKIPLFGA